MSRVHAREAQRIGLQKQIDGELLPTKTESNRAARQIRSANISRTLAAKR